jgi:hypothetical protein
MHVDRLDLKRKAEDASRKALAHRYDDKLRTASMRIENHDVIQREARNYNRLTEDLKTANAKKVCPSYPEQGADGSSTEGVRGSSTQKRVASTKDCRTEPLQLQWGKQAQAHWERSKTRSGSQKC